MTRHLDQKQFSYADYMNWPEDKHYELIDGYPILQAAPSPRHQDVVLGIGAQFYAYLTGKPCKVYLAPFTVRLPDKGQRRNNQIRNVVEPDISVVCQQNKIDSKGCKGAPDLIVEVVSPTSVKRDMMTKFALYEQARVREYWVVQPENRMLTVYLMDETVKYGRPMHYAESDEVPVHIFSDFTVALEKVWGELPSGKES